MITSEALSITSGRSTRKRVVTSVNQTSRETISYFLGLVILVLICSLFYIWSRVQIVNIGYGISREVLLKEQLLEENRKLIYETALLRSPIRLEKLAKNDFRMKLPEKTQILNSIHLKSLELNPSIAKEEKKPKLIVSKKQLSKTDPLKNSQVEKNNRVIIRKQT